MQKKNIPIRPLILIVIGLLLIIGAVVFYIISSQLQPPQASFTPQLATSEGTYPEIPRITVGDAKAAYYLKLAVFVDARDADSFAAGHIPGAINIPEDELASRMGELKKSDWIITYCT